MITYVYVYQWVFNVIPDQAGSHMLDIIYSYWVFAGLAPLQVKLTFHSLNYRLSLLLIHPDLPHGPVCQRVQYQLPQGDRSCLPGLLRPLLRILQGLHRAEHWGTDHPRQMLSESSRWQLSGIHVIFVVFGSEAEVSKNCKFVM